MTKKIFPVVGMHCASCKMLIEKMVGKLSGIEEVAVNYGTEKMNITFDESKVSLNDIREAVKRAGSYTVVTDESGEQVLASPAEVEKMKGDMHDHASALKDEEYQSLKKRVMWVGIGAIPFVLMMVYMASILLGVTEMTHAPLGFLSFDSFNYKINVFHLVQFFLATPILFIGGKQFFISTWQA